MIEIAKLEKTFLAETAADKWWDGLNKKEQQAYIKAHPRSKYAKKVSSSAANKAGGSLHMDDIDPRVSARWAKKNGVRHEITPGEGGTEEMSKFHWTPENAAKVHSYVKKVYASTPEDRNGWADTSAHHEIPGWSKLHKHVTGKSRPRGTY